MDKKIMSWLLEDDNPAVKYRTLTEILDESADKAPVISWINAYLPDNWKERKGLWSTYYLNSFAECGLAFDDIGLDIATAIGFGESNGFEEGCGDFMRLRALIRLGLGNEAAVVDIINRLPERQLPDGGFLCSHRLAKMNYIPKSCVKANMHALVFCAECKKRGIATDIENPLVEYFWNHSLFYRTDNPGVLILSAREGWRSIDTFYPFEAMRVGLQNIVEALSALGYGNDPRMCEAWDILGGKRDLEGRCLLEGTLTKSFLPREGVGKPSKWVTFYALLAQKHASLL